MNGYKVCNYFFNNKYNQLINNDKDINHENENFIYDNELEQKKELKKELLIKRFIKLIFIVILIIILILSIFNHSNSDKINVAFYNYCIRYGGIERVTAILLNYFYKEDNFNFYLITVSGILEGEYSIPSNIKRICLSEQKTNIYRAIRMEKIDILINNYDDPNQIIKLNKLNSIKVIHCTHSVFLYRIYQHYYHIENTVYQAYKNCKYVLALVPLENDYLFKIWGINSLLMENPLTFEFNSVVPSDLSQKNIIMMGRGNDPAKRFELGIISMKNIVKVIPESTMYLISSFYKNLDKKIQSLNLEKNVKITGFQNNPGIYLKNASLHIFASLSEAYPMVLAEVKIYGIPSILCGLDYVILAKGGTVIIYDDDPDTIAKEAIKILKDDEYRKKLGNEARESMKNLSNEIIVKKWLKLFLSIYNGLDPSSFSNLFEESYKRITEEEANIILNNQLNLLKKRKPNFKDLTLENLKLYSLE